MTLEELAKWHESQAEQAYTDGHRTRHVATAAAMRELAHHYNEPPLPGDSVPDDEWTEHDEWSDELDAMSDQTQAALERIKP